ncbi:hypothetical protein ACNJ7K_10890 [Rhodococcus aetherivorans]
MRPEIIVMLTHHDVTVPNAREVFREAADLPVNFWGFKDIGLSLKESEQLVTDFRDAGKTAVLEAVNFSETDMLSTVSFAADCGIEYLTGGQFTETVRNKVRDAGMKYFPFCGETHGPPITLSGTLDDIEQDVTRLLELGVDGVDLVAYRYTDGDPIELARRVIATAGGERTIVAGSINSVERIRLMHDLGPFGFTIGGALFEGTLRPGHSFRDNLRAAVEAGETVSEAAQ